MSGTQRATPTTTITARLFTISQTAQILSVSPDSVRRLIADGTLSAVRLRRNVRIDGKAIDRLIERNREGAR